MSLIKFQEIWKNEQWAMREVCINLGYITRVLPIDIKIEDVKKNCSEALKELNNNAEFSKVIFVEGQHSNSCLVVGNVSQVYHKVTGK